MVMANSDALIDQTALIQRVLELEGQLGQSQRELDKQVSPNFFKSVTKSNMFNDAGLAIEQVPRQVGKVP